MEEYYVSFKEKRSIHAASLGSGLFKNAFRERQWLLKNKGRYITMPTVGFGCGQEVPITCEAITAFIGLSRSNSHSIFRNKVEDKANQFQWRVTALPFLSLVSLFQPLDRTMRADSVITLATKIDKDAPSMKQAKPVVPHPHTPPDLLKVAIKVLGMKDSLWKLAKSIPSMIQLAIKKAMQLARDKLKSLCSTVKVLESEVITEERGSCTQWTSIYR
ncbi:hypothetical protein HAX54_017801 [Datura stramonium]|uniref:Uncharacterized protein n=1 Tax=Datura stramonium TaxID=4076 RepID=A0ABS8ULH3_DATST|nr:hypothetical protein [Datura stramonium]